MPRSSLRALALAAPLALALTACGGADDKTDAPAKGQVKETAPAGVAHQHTVVEAEIAARGGETKAGEYRIGYIVEAAEPWFESKGGKSGEHAEHGMDGELVNREPAKDETHHIEIIPFEAKTGRIVPNVPIRLEVVDSKGKVVQAQDLNFYYAEFFHYANNFSIPKDGKYTLRATLQAPTFLRHGASGEKPALSEKVTATFRDVELKSES
ncbi:iron transporter [Streptomyces sp. 8N706]|uniref:iron transporter n=1 Tax=Streptomyces sp. 8N706 TaxID=3457416 RepID=UPI003FD31944